MSDYPVGALWRAEGTNGICEVWLTRRSGGSEMWRWSFCFRDGSGMKNDWGTTKRTVIEECKMYLAGPVRFTRVKDGVRYQACHDA